MQKTKPKTQQTQPRALTSLDQPSGFQFTVLVLNWVAFLNCPNTPITHYSILNYLDNSKLYMFIFIRVLNCILF